MMKEYKKPEIKVIDFDTDDIIMTSGNDLVSGTLNTKSGINGATPFQTNWIGNLPVDGQ